MAKNPVPNQAASHAAAMSGASGDSSGAFMTGAQASVEGLTGRYLVLLQPGKAAEVERSLADTAGIKVMSLATGDTTAIGNNSIAEGEGLLFGDIGVAVVKPVPDQLNSVSAAVAQSSAMQDMEPERFVYASADFDVAYLRGFRDAVNHLYDRLTEPEPLGHGAAASAFVENGQVAWHLMATRVNSSSQSGRGVKIAILDTGIDLSHPDFQGRQLSYQSFVEGEPVQDGHGHGTHCAGIACGPVQPRSLPRYGVASEAELLIGKVLANSGQGTDSTILSGIRWAMSEGATIISMSLGGRVAAEQNYSNIFQQVAERAIQNGTLIIAAAGNDSDRPRSRLEAVSHPANCPAIMAVGAVDRELRPAWFSNAGLNMIGGKVDIAAPGVDVISAWPGTKQYHRLDGTSMATPCVAGIAALYAQRFPNLRGDALWARLVQQAQPLAAPARDVGAGLVQAPQ